MTTSDQFYVNRFINEPPRHVLDSTHSQMTSALKANEELADYFRDRAQIEDVYVKSLSKITKKYQLSNKHIFGTFLPMWETLYQEINSLCNIHLEFSKKIAGEIEQPLRQCMTNNSDFHQVRSMEESLGKMCKENEDLESKIQKHKKNGSKGESKAAECIKQQEKRHQEWLDKIPGYLQSHQALNEYQWTMMKSLVRSFELIQKETLEKRLDLTQTAIAITDSLTAENEIIQFCTSNALQEGHRPISASRLSDSSIKQSSLLSKKKRLFPSFGSMRRRSKNILHDVPRQDIQRNFSHTGSLVEITNMQTAQDQHRHNTIPNLRKAASFAATTSDQPSPVQSREITMDAEETEEMSSDTGSVFSSNATPRLRISIKNETMKEDESNQADALIRVATLLKEKDKNPTRKSRGRREARGTNLYSVNEQSSGLELCSSSEDMNEPHTIHVSTLETLDVISRHGKIEQATLSGRVYIQSISSTQNTPAACFELQLPPFTTLELTDHVCSIANNTFQLNAPLQQTTLVMTYQTPLNQLPIELKPMWKCDTEKSRLMVKYQKAMDGLKNVMFATSMPGGVKHVTSIPSGDLNLAQHRIKWDIPEDQGIIRAQFDTTDMGSAQPIAVKFESDQLLSQSKVMTGDDPNLSWTTIKEQKTQTKAGKFIVF
ncbi:hypothetical protein BY458DRAFT_515031 [Sporodiniella umbellata]|nr:hypothetical protein BY458DRAFT_515031 [Sporodiniella umbellata]